jgi:hypothetical protein
MRNNILILWIVCFSFLLNSCTKDIDLPIPETTPRLVMNGVVEPDSLFVLNLSRSVSAKSGNQPSYINDAKVEIYENGMLLSTLKYVPASSIFSPDGNYSDSNLRFLPGHTYTFKAFKSGFTDVLASVKMPMRSNIDTLSVKNVILTSGGGLGGSSQTSKGKSVTFKIKDPDLTEKNYYLLRVLPYDSSFITFYYADLGTNNINLQELNDLQGSTETAYQLYLNDALFTNGIFEGELHYTVFDGWGQGAPTLKYFLEILSISKDYYYYLSSVDSYNNSNGNPFAEPSQITTNVTNGYGMIGAQVVKRFRLP